MQHPDHSRRHCRDPVGDVSADLALAVILGYWPALSVAFRGNVPPFLGFMQQHLDGQSIVHDFSAPQRAGRVFFDVYALLAMLGG
jgi:hypothetical protein